MNQLPKVSIVTPSYNQAQFLEETILSVISQDYPNIEYIVIDGGSTDSSVEIIRKYESRLAYWVTEADRGQSDAINKGWSRCTGQLMAWLNSDDTYEPGAMSAAVNAFREHPEAYLVYGHLNHIDDRGNLIRKFHVPPYDLRSFIGGNMTCYIRQPTTFIRREALDRVGLLDLSLKYSMDHDLFIRICREFPAHRIPRTMANFRFHAASKSMSDIATKAKNTFWPEERALMERVANDPRFPGDVRALAWKRIGVRWYDYRETARSREVLLRAMITDKSLAADWQLLSLLAKSLLGRRILDALARTRIAISSLLLN